MDNRNLSYSSNGVIKVCIKHHVLMVVLRVIKVCIKHHVLMVVLRVITLLLITFKLLLVYTLQILLRGNNIIILPVLEGMWTHLTGGHVPHLVRSQLCQHIHRTI